MGGKTAVQWRGPVRLSRPRRAGLTVVGVGLWLSGTAWILFHYFLTRPGQFGPSPHPLDPWWLRLHGAFAMAVIWSAGLLWAAHIVNGWRSGRRRVSGVFLAGILGWLILSGYLLYYVGDEAAREWISRLHWIIGLSLPALYVTHRLAARLGRAVRGPEMAPAPLLPERIVPAKRLPPAI